MVQGPEKPVSATTGVKGHTEAPWGPKRQHSLTVYGGVASRLLATAYKLVYGTAGSANAALIAIAPTAPHECDDPKCPGMVNSQKLKLTTELKGCLEYVLQVVCEDRDSECMYCGEVPNQSVATESHEPTGHKDHCIVPGARKVLEQWQRLNSAPSPSNRVVRLEDCGCYSTQDGVWHAWCQDHYDYDEFHPR